MSLDRGNTLVFEQAGRPQSRFCARRVAYAVALGLVFARIGSAEGVAAKRQPAPPSNSISATTRAMRHDAALASVSFVNRSVGWAVGDCGVIWNTRDGGTTWHEQQSGVACQLNAVYFIDERRGWVVGGESRPGSGTRGVVLRTDDGGDTWGAVPGIILPRLCGAKFFDSDHGIAFGEAANYSPAGVFTTRDGGNTWQQLATDRSGDWLAGDFVDAGNGAIAGGGGQFATVGRNKTVHSPLATPSLRSFRALRLAPPIGGWAVGDGGLLLRTQDLGRSWQTPPTELPQAIASSFDFAAVAARGTHVWAAGTPGTRIVHSPDNGQSWETIATGQTAPIRALTFIDEQYGWAVGDLGNIIATQDGGRTWKAQRAGGKRAALLAFFADADDVPLELLADAGAAEGYVVAVNLLSAPTSVEATSRESMINRWQEVLLASGAASANTAWRFPLPAADLALSGADLVQTLNRENDGRAIQQLRHHVVRELRMWRPDVVVTYHDPVAAQPMPVLVEQIVAEAIPAAADPNQHAELASGADLAPWQVKKAFGVLSPGARGDELVAGGRFSPWLGRALADFVAPARRLLGETQNPPPDTHELKLLYTHVADDSNSRGLFGGISLAPGSDARRLLGEAPTHDVEALRRLATRRRHLQELMERTEGNAAWAAQASSMIDDLDSDDAGQLLVQLADGYRRAGRLDLAADTYFLFARRFTDHPLTEQALEWLVKFYASNEIAHRLKVSLGDPLLANETRRRRDAPDHFVQQASAPETLPASSPALGLSRDDRLRRASQLADYLRTARPALYAEPSIRFAETAAQRELGYASPAQRLFLMLRQLPESDPWRVCAASEEWLAHPGDTPPAKKLAACRSTPEAPQLDGKLDETFWSSADYLLLTNGDGTQSAEGRANVAVSKNARAERMVRPTGASIQLAYDQEFIYLAVHCPKVQTCDYRADSAPRPRDADLIQHDRVTVRFDIDRDYGTAYELTVDARGWTHDACWGDATWNPTWYVAAASDETTWTVEAAIPLNELTSKAPEARQVWAIGARRTIPRVGYQSWSGSAASNDSPDQFGLLIFE